MMGFENGRHTVPAGVVMAAQDLHEGSTQKPPCSDATSTNLSSSTSSPATAHHPLTASSPSLSRSDSLTSMDPDMLIDELLSDDLDKLSNCLSEVSSETKAPGGTPTTSIFYDIIQAQLALWTCVGSLMYSYAWRQHRKKFIFSIFFVIPTVITVCCAISGLLTTIVILSRLFSTPFAYNDFLAYANQQDEARGGSPQPAGRLRSYSGASSQSSTDDLLPKPLCRRHSSTSSVCGAPSSLLTSSRPPSRKLSYCYSHFSASQEQLNDYK